MRRRTIGTMILGLAALGYLATGFAVVAPGEAVVVRRLGRVQPRPWTAGLHWGGPFGIDVRDRIRTDEVRRLAIGLADVPGPADEPDAGEYLTGDLNLLRARAVVQYRVSGPLDYALRAEDTDRLLARLAESSLTRALARRGIDGALREERAALADEAAADLALAVARRRLGLTILGLSLTDARPPAEVQPDFAAAQAAQSDHDRRLREAETYAATSRTAALAAAGAKRDEALARADRAVAIARARADRFLALLAEADRSRPLTVRRLFRDALRDVLPRVRRKVLMTPEEPVDLSLFGVEE